MEEEFDTILLQSQARGEAEVGRDDRLVEVVDVQLSEPGALSYCHRNTLTPCHSVSLTPCHRVDSARGSG